MMDSKLGRFVKQCLHYMLKLSEFVVSFVDYRKTNYSLADFRELRKNKLYSDNMYCQTFGVVI